MKEICYMPPNPMNDKPELCECLRFGGQCPNPATHQFDATEIWYCDDCWDWLQDLLDRIAAGER